MKLKLISGVFVMVVCLLVAICLADSGLPEDFSGITEGHPDSTIVEIIQLPKAIQVRMRSGALKSDIYSFYKEELTAKDWIVAAENESMLLLIKGEHQLTVSFIKNADYNFDYSLTLFKGN